MKRICEFCKKEYDWEEGQPNWKKDGTLGTNPGSISSKRFCCYACGKIYQSDLQKQTRIKKSIENPNYYKEMIEKVRLTSLQKYKNAIKIYTISYPLKRQTAKENNLNWIEFFNMKEFEEWYNGI